MSDIGFGAGLGWAIVGDPGGLGDLGGEPGGLGVGFLVGALVGTGVGVLGGVPCIDCCGLGVGCGFVGFVVVPG